MFTSFNIITPLNICVLLIVIKIPFFQLFPFSTGNLKEKSFKVRSYTSILLTRGEEIYLTGEFWRRNFSQSACLVPNLYFEKMYVPTAPWNWVCSRQRVSGMGVKHLLIPLRPEWESVWLGMKCSEARCDCTAKARPPVSQLSCRCIYIYPV